VNGEGRELAENYLDGRELQIMREYAI